MRKQDKRISERETATERGEETDTHTQRNTDREYKNTFNLGIFLSSPFDVCMLQSVSAVLTSWRDTRISCPHIVVRAPHRDEHASDM